MTDDSANADGPDVDADADPDPETNLSLGDLPQPIDETTVPVEQLSVDGDNPNEQNDEMFGLLCDNMRKHGWIGNAIVCDTDYTIADGEHRWRAAKKIGLDEVPVKVYDIDEPTRRLWRQELNKISGEHDTKRDALEYDYLLDNGKSDAVSSLTNATGEDLDALLAELRIDRSAPVAYEYNVDHNVYFEDCLDGMRERLDDDEIDLVLTDPPYGIDTSEMGYITNPGGVADPNDYAEYDWDDEPLDDETLAEIFRVGKNAIIFGGNYIADRVPPSPCWISWDKTGGMTSSDYADVELAWTSFDSPARVFRHKWRGMLRDGDDVRYHPTQKPVALMAFCITEYTNPGDTILDPFMGSGTTAVAAIQNDRNYIGFEIDAENYQPVIERRIREATRQVEREGGDDADSTAADTNTNTDSSQQRETSETPPEADD